MYKGMFQSVFTNCELQCLLTCSNQCIVVGELLYVLQDVLMYLIMVSSRAVMVCACVRACVCVSVCVDVSRWLL